MRDDGSERPTRSEIHRAWFVLAVSSAAAVFFALVWVFDPHGRPAWQSWVSVGAFAATAAGSGVEVMRLRRRGRRHGVDPWSG